MNVYLNHNGIQLQQFSFLSNLPSKSTNGNRDATFLFYFPQGISMYIALFRQNMSLAVLSN